MAFFDLIAVVLKLLKLWDFFLSYMDKKYSADLEVKRQAREKAIDDSKKAETDEEIWKSQDDITNNMP